MDHSRVGRHVAGQVMSSLVRLLTVVTVKHIILPFFFFYFNSSPILIYSVTSSRVTLKRLRAFKAVLTNITGITLE